MVSHKIECKEEKSKELEKKYLYTNLFDRFSNVEEREELKMLPGILTVSTRYRDPTQCLRWIVTSNSKLLKMLREFATLYF